MYESSISRVKDDQWHQMIATAAYYRAEIRGFRDGDPVADWLEAEAEIARLFGHTVSTADPALGAAKRQFVEQLESELRTFDAALDRHADKARKSRKKAIRVEYENQVESLAEMRTAAQHKLRELKNRSEAAWEDLKSGAETLWEDLRQTIARMASRFK